MPSSHLKSKVPSPKSYVLRLTSHVLRLKSQILKILQNILRQLVVQVGPGVAAHDEVVFVGEEELVVFHTGFVKGFHQLHGVLEVHVVVGGAVDKQIFAFDVFTACGG